ncbi:hypothetical protein PG326_07905 [Riemerella anatipestifer]|nr:hypothetical protein [Riemerella anatipestifer]MDY3358250.1 hypothetical protein [Riemerella anatipestifer]
MIIILILSIFILSIILFFIFVKKFNGLKDVSIIISCILVLVFASFYIFGDSDSEIVKNILNESKLKLNDDFKIVNNEDSQTLVDYHINYEISISEKDKNNLISQIESTKKFQRLKDENEYDDYLKNEYVKEVDGSQIIRNFFLKNGYYRMITFSNSSRKLEIEVEATENKVKITDEAD